VIFADLLLAHKAQLGKAEARFSSPDNADFKRHLAGAATRVSMKRQRWVSAELEAVAGQSDYPAPSDSYEFATTDWGKGLIGNPWDEGFVGWIPRMIGIEIASMPYWRLVPEPSSAQIARWGATVHYTYFAKHEISATRITLADADQPLVLLAALIEAMRELSADTTVVQLQKGLVGLPTAGTPAYLYEKLLAEWERA